MTGHRPSSRRKKTIKAPASTEPNSKEKASCVDDEIESETFSALPASQKETTATCERELRKPDCVFITANESIKSYESEFLQNITESSSSLEFRVPASNESFERHVFDGTPIRIEPLAILQGKPNILDPLVPKNATPPGMIEDFDYQKFCSLLVSKHPPAHGDYKEETPEAQLMAEKMLIKEAILATLEEFFAGERDNLILTMSVERHGTIPTLDIRMDEMHISIANSSVTAHSGTPATIGTGSDQVVIETPNQSNVSTYVKEWRCHKHRNFESSAATMQNSMSCNSSSYCHLCFHDTTETVNSSSHASQSPSMLSAQVSDRNFIGSMFDSITSFMQPLNLCCRNRRVQSESFRNRSKK